MIEPKCYYGYTFDQIQEIIPEDLWDHYLKVSAGSTFAVCEGQCCEEAHGGVVYKWDVMKFFEIEGLS